MKKIIICLFLLIGLGSCHIYKAYEHPDMMVVDSLYRRPVVTEDTVSLASLSWRELFTDIRLQELIEMGIRNNTDLNIARLRVKEAEALLLSSKLAYLPSLSLSFPAITFTVSPFLIFIVDILRHLLIVLPELMKQSS